MNSKKIILFFRLLQEMAHQGYLKASDCDLPSAKVYPGKWHAKNKMGSLEFNSKDEWIKNEVRKWFEHMKYKTNYQWKKLFNNNKKKIQLKYYIVLKNKN